MDKYFLPQIRGNSVSSPKKKTSLLQNCNIQKINPALKLSKGKKIRINNGNVLRTCTEFYTHTAPPVKHYTRQVITGRGKSTVEYQPVMQINKKALCRRALYSFPSSNVAVTVIYNINDLQSQFLKSTSKSPATAHRTRVAEEPNLEEMLWKRPDLQPGQGIARHTTARPADCSTSHCCCHCCRRAMLMTVTESTWARRQLHGSSTLSAKSRCHHWWQAGLATLLARAAGGQKRCKCFSVPVD